MMETTVIVGAGLAGFHLATALREQHYPGGILLLGEESHRPYHRPPLSKGYLLGSAPDASIDMRPAPFYADKQIELRLGSQAVAIDRAQHRLRMHDGSSIDYSHLILAVGARNRRLQVPGSDLQGVFYLRDLDDARAVRAALPAAQRVVVIGAGFIGLEFAAAALKAGAAVTVLDVADRPMSRALSVPTSDLFEREHSRNGMRFAFATQVKQVIGAAGKTVAVETTNGQVFPCDTVLVGIGVTPNVELAAASGLEVRNGIVVDSHLSTADPAISAIGDCAAHPNPFADNALVRLESVQNATDQARCVAARILGKPRPYTAVPWFWSDQGPLKLQIAGLTAGCDQTVIRGEPTGTSSTVFCFRDGRLSGVETVNRPGEHLIARRLLGSRCPITPAQAGDPTVDLKRLVGATATS
jgi:3-phenylpropionate/trans-cinnamate dioxygenase ferredoxin reductase component